MTRVAAGLMVLQSMTSVPGRAPWLTPRSPRMTSSTSGVSLTQVTMMPQLAATSAGLSATAAPAVASGVTRPGVRFHTVRLNPALSKLAAIPPPIMPSPMKPTDSFMNEL